jgi:hypothetical protein
VWLYVLATPFLAPLYTWLVVTAVVAGSAEKVSPRFFEVAATVIPVLLLTLMVESRFYSAAWFIRAAETTIEGRTHRWWTRRLRSSTPISSGRTQRSGWLSVER